MKAVTGVLASNNDWIHKEFLPFPGIKRAKEKPANLLHYLQI